MPSEGDAELWAVRQARWLPQTRENRPGAVSAVAERDLFNGVSNSLAEEEQHEAGANSAVL
jgi:hypothetical protein